MIDNATEKMTQLYGTLRDALSREVFDARLMVDVCPTVSHLTQLIKLNVHMSPEDAARIEHLSRILSIIKFVRQIGRSRD